MDIKTTKKDLMVSLTKGVIGAAPFVGPLAAEVIENIIPNQRIDRIARFIEILDKKVAKLDHDRIKTKFTNPGFIDLLEDGFFQVARALTEERKKYIASIIKNSLSEEQVEYVEYKKLLSLLGELNDIEVIILNSHERFHMDDQEFFEKHKAILTSPPAHLGSSQEEVDKATIYQTYKHHLARLGLLRQRFKKPGRGELPEFDEKTGILKASGYDITPLGRLLLRYIDLLPEE
jgi:hypothetical protein